MNAPVNEKHLDLLQGVINRMAGNSFLLKGWSVTLVAALLALAAGGAKPALVAVALLPATMFWGLDGYFLAQERLFRKIYEGVVDRNASVKDYALNPGPCPLSLVLKAAMRPTLLAFHGTILLVIVVVLRFLAH